MQVHVCKGPATPSNFRHKTLMSLPSQGHSPMPLSSLTSLLPMVCATAAASRHGLLEFQTGQAERETTVCLLGHHYPPELHHLYPWEETTPGQEQQFE